ncbi:SAM-dependent methyltransferase [Spongiactinospora sp. TRM90649]|uniref:SAM-dependent methyltransferase n=1 Tax=Spongiactinospora sp. TRM90649 TaxID=3031114 RepID=UPI0023F6A08E|nr:SAM-dependent methyltransferase [Spongiactinospora sp. TRM90649]MDF5756583.1 SAM-dependent methyltransferase [Spongiactinospora sp. TRM90649]
MYDYGLGGTTNYRIDREISDKLWAAAPDLPALTHDGRRFLERVVRFMVEAGVDQIIDIGSGLPTANNVHQVAQAINPAVRVVYVDNDPTVHIHAQALLSGDERTRYVDSDARTPAQIINHPHTQRLIDFTRPVGLMYLYLLHYIADADDPYGSVRRVLDELASGSYLVISHVTQEGTDPHLHATFQKVFSGVIFRTKAEILRFFDGWDIITPPGMVNVSEWSATGDAPGEPRALRAWTAVAIKP